MHNQRPSRSVMSVRVLARLPDLAKPTDKVVGGLFPNDADVNAWGDPQRGLPPSLAQTGYRLIDAGRYRVMNDAYTLQITRFKEAGAQIVTGNMIPPDFATFWSQAAQQNFHPKIVTIGKALLFPSVVNSLGPRGNGLTTEIWWTPTFPFKSGLTGQSELTTEGNSSALPMVTTLGWKFCCAACDQNVEKSGGIILPTTISAPASLNFV